MAAAIDAAPSCSCANGFATNVHEKIVSRSSRKEAADWENISCSCAGSWFLVFVGTSEVPPAEHPPVVEKFELTVDGVPQLAAAAPRSRETEYSQSVSKASNGGSGGGAACCVGRKTALSLIPFIPTGTKASW